jgi:hypothetical protein
MIKKKNATAGRHNGYFTGLNALMKQKDPAIPCLSWISTFWTAILKH